MIKKYRKKPVVIEAIHLESISDFVKARHWAVQCGSEDLVDYDDSPDVSHLNPALMIFLDGMMVAKTGDWLIRGTEGEFYPCRDDIFQATYEEVVDEIS